MTPSPDKFADITKLSMTTHLIFIRHGMSTWNEARRWQGSANPPLSESGRRQVELLARRLARWKIDYLYSSDLARAAETAEIIGTALGIQPISDSLWRERGFGALEGLTSEEIAAQYPEVWASRMMGPIAGVPGAEPQSDVIARSLAACSNILAQHQGQKVAIVSHGGMILTTLVNILGLPPAGHALLVVGGNTSISRVTIESGHARLTGLNDTAHLELLDA